ncbi:MAG: methyltransferase domain-containing protein [Cyclobacteriaceae bacterium]
MSNTTSNSPYFSGSIPKSYDEYLGPMFFEPYAIDIAARIDPSGINIALELGSGTGRVTRHLRKSIPEASLLVASDISQDMLAVAMDKLKSLSIDWRIIDAHELPFSDNSVDLIVCCFGYMFVSDKRKAFAEAYRVLRPRGTLLMATWDRLEVNEASYVFRTIVKDYFGDSLPETYKLPFSMNDPSMIEDSLRAAGFSKVRSEIVEKETQCITARDAAHGLVKGGSLYTEIMNRDPEWLDEIISKVEKTLSDKYGEAPMIAPMRAVVCQAWK